MYKQFHILRKKMEKFNKWEAEYRMSLPISKRLEQFIMLYDLGKMYDGEILKRMNEEHLDAIINTNKRIRSHKKLSPV